MERESRARKNPNYDGICFHAQQCAEKYLKARLHESGIDVVKTHDLVSLLDKIISTEPAWEIFRKDLAFLSQFAVNFRYPGDAADKETALDARNHCRKFRSAARKSLRLKKSK